MPDEFEQLRVELDDARAEILRLRQEVNRLQAILSALSIKRASEPSAPIPAKPLFDAGTPSVPSRTVHLAADDRVRIFRSLFRGREDVYAARARQPAK